MNGSSDEETIILTRQPCNHPDELASDAEELVRCNKHRHRPICTASSFFRPFLYSDSSPTTSGRTPEFGDQRAASHVPERPTYSAY